MAAMPAGVVSNCFRSQLDAGEPLAGLVDQATALGYSVIELRQGCLGDCESPGELVPDPDRLQALATACPGVQWDLALGYPCFDPSTSGDDAVFVFAQMVYVIGAVGLAQFGLTGLIDTGNDEMHGRGVSLNRVVWKR